MDWTYSHITYIKHMKKILLLTLLIPTLSFADITKDLKFGMKDTQIKELQQFLIDKGYIPKGSKTGYFGAKTLQGVRRYQKDSKLPATGFVGRLTRVSIGNDNKIVELASVATQNIEVATTTSTTTTPVNAPMFPINTVVPTPEKVYNIVIMEETTKPYTLGTPTLITKKTPSDVEYSYIEIPVTLDSSILKAGYTVTFLGTVTNGDNINTGQGASNQLNSQSLPNYVLNLWNETGGTYDYTMTVTDSKGATVYTTNDTIQLQ